MSQLFPAHPMAHFVATSPQQKPNCLEELLETAMELLNKPGIIEKSIRKVLKL